MAIGDTEIIELASGVYARRHEGLTNAGIVIGDDGVLLIDSLRVPSYARALIADVKQLTDLPVRYVIDTHSHWDHAWGNEEFLDATIVGHRNCRAEMLDIEVQQRWRDYVVNANAPFSEETKTVTITPPALTFDDRMSLYLGGRQIDLWYLGRAHTSGDIFIHLPDDGVLFTGDVVQDRAVPSMLDGYVRDWVDTDQRLLELPCELFMPGHGLLGERPAIAEARDFIVALVDGVEAAIAEGRPRDGAAAAVKTSMTERFGGWDGFDAIEDSLRYAYDQMRAG